MDISSFKLIRANIVLVYEDLRKANISRDKLFKIVDGAKPENFDVGEFIIIRYPTYKAQTIVLLDQNRIEAQIDLPDENTLQKLTKLADNARKAVKRSNIKAYGYNYFSILQCNDCDASNFLLKEFDESLKPINNQIEGSLTSLSVVLKYQKDDLVHQLSIEPDANNKKIMHFTMNIHFDTSDFPDIYNLRENYSKLIDDFYRTIERLFA